MTTINTFSTLISGDETRSWVYQSETRFLHNIL